jgi:hypothetical protein
MATNLQGTSADATIPAVKGDFTGTGPDYVHDGGKGVQGHSQNGYGVHGISEVGRGVVAESDTNYGLRAVSRTLSAARCSSSEGTGVEGEAGSSGDGVRGTSKSGSGVHGFSETEYGVKGESNSGRGVAAFSDTNYGLRAVSRTLAAARCSSTNGNGVEGEAGGSGAGIVGTSTGGIGVFGRGGRLAGRFEGDVEVTGDIRLVNADFAEDFDVVEETEPGEVMVLTETGALQPSRKAYDKKVVGVLSGAGSYKPGIILDKQDNDSNRKPVAMMGKVFCKVDADISPIEIGDMLTTSDIPGYAMKAIDHSKAFGAVMGKALASLKEGRGLIPILVVLQ